MKLPILEYHNILPQTRIALISAKKYTLEDYIFEQQIRNLKDNGYSCINFSDVKNSLFSSYNLPAKPIVITFDDGMEDNYNVAFPILKRYNVKATFFIVTNLVGKENFLHWNQIIEMSNEGMEFQSHTHTHRNLSELSNDEIQKELNLSKNILEEKLNKQIGVVALPFGRGDNKNVKEIALASGYLFACNSTWGDNNINKNSFYLNRFGINVDCSMEQFRSFVELQKIPLMHYKLKKMPVRLAKAILGKSIYAKLRSMLLEGL